MRLVIVPNELRDAINDSIDRARVRAGISALELSDSRPTIYQALLEYFDEHGTVPDIDLKRNEGPT